MRPLVVAHLVGAGWGWLAPFVPTDGGVYAILFIALVALFLKRSERAGIDSEQALGAAVSGGIGALVGARLFYLVTTGDLFRLAPRYWPDPGAGTASWGAYLGGLIGVVVFCRVAAAPMWAIVDTGASCAGLSEVIGRWACLLAGDDFGRVTGAAWAIRFPSGSPAFRAHVARGLLDPAASSSLPVHPLQLYLILNGLIVFGAATVVWRRPHAPGRPLAAFLLLQGSTRFWWEFLRDPAAGGARGVLSVSQWSCAGMVVLGLLLALRRGRTGGDIPAAAAAA